MSLRPRAILVALAPLALMACGNGGTSTNTGGNDGGGGAASGPTWAEDVAPILMKNCANCHVQGGIAPFPLLTYDDARAVAGAAKLATAARTMPPENLDNTGDCNTFSDARWLTDDEIATIGAWVDAGAPEGDPAKAPPPPGAPVGLPQKSVTLDMGVTYTPDASQTDEYRCFIVDPGIATDKFLTGFQVNPGDKRVVHHMILFSLDSAAAEQQASAADAADPKPGYQCFGGPGVNESRFMAGWAPGGGATIYAEGTGIRMNAGRKMVMQIHYNLANGSYPDRTTMDLMLGDSVLKEATITRVAAKNINLPPGQALATATGSAAVPASKGAIVVYGVAPHMHTLGKTQDAWYDGPNGQKTCLSKVTDWNFHWQGFATFSQPIELTAGGSLGVTCGYDTSHQTMTVTNGESTSDEMCIDSLYVTAK